MYYFSDSMCFYYVRENIASLNHEDVRAVSRGITRLVVLRVQEIRSQQTTYHCLTLQLVCFGETKPSEDSFLEQRSASPREELQTKHSAHSAAPLHPTDKRWMRDKHSQQKTSLFPPIIESNAKWGRRQNFKILYTLAFGEAH